MKLSIRHLLIAALVALTACDSSDRALETDPEVHASTVNRFCVDCHNDAERTAGLSLEGVDLADLGADPALWETVIRKLRAGMMPPADSLMPAGDTRDGLAAFLEDELDVLAERSPNPGRDVPFHRLNRTEYRNAIRDLLDLDIDVSELLPADDSSFGFDNIAGVLKVSPTLLERYLTAAERISRLATGEPAPFVNIDWFRIPDDRSQESRLPGLPFGTRGGTRVDYNFPVDGEYEFAVELQRDLNEQLPLYAEEQNIEIAVDGERLAVFTLAAVPLTEPEPPPPPPSTDEGEAAERPISQIVQRLSLSREGRAARNRADENCRVRVPVAAGRHVVTATFLNRTSALAETARLPFGRPYPAGVNIPETRSGAYLRSLEVSGPFEAAGPGDTSSRQRIYACEPAGDDALAGASIDCAEDILQRLARLAYRRNVGEADILPLLEFFREGAREDFNAGLQLAIKRLLVSPEFLFRIERDPPETFPGEPYLVSDFELASRLSFFLWSSIPDDELLDIAASGSLTEPETLRSQVDRMLADQKADAFIENFAGQWLFLRNLDAIVPVQSIFPDFDDTLRVGLRRETELFFESIVRDDRSVRELLTADYTFLNGRVAQHYGISGVEGPHFRRVTLGPENPRRGLLGHGSILAVTSYPDRTSPVVRGKWILENLLGAPPPDPPPDVPGLAETDGEGLKLTMRERLAVHRADPTCASCHALMDPLGFALENFDAVGRWRTIGDAGEDIDARGNTPDGNEFVGVEGLRQALLSSDLFVTTMTEKLMTYALGRGVESYDMPTVRRIVREAETEDHRFSSYIVGIANSPAFRMRMPAAGESR